MPLSIPPDTLGIIQYEVVSMDVVPGVVVGVPMEVAMDVVDGTSAAHDRHNKVCRAHRCLKTVESQLATTNRCC